MKLLQELCEAPAIPGREKPLIDIMSKINFPSKDPIVKLKKTMNGYGYNKKTIISYLYYITELLDFAKKNTEKHKHR